MKQREEFCNQEQMEELLELALEKGWATKTYRAAGREDRWLVVCYDTSEELLEKERGR